MEDSQKVQSFVQSYLEKHELTDNLQLIWQASEQVPLKIRNSTAICRLRKNARSKKINSKFDVSAQVHGD